MSKGKKGCFQAGTKISTPDGYVPIEFINIDDEVYAFDKSGDISIGKVTETFKHSTKDTGDKILEVMHENGIMYPTDNHWILCSDGISFKETKEFDLDEYVTLEDGSQSKITGLINGEEIEYTYNISVYPQHTFIADGVRVHNKGGSKGGGGSARVPVEAPDSLQSVAFVRIVDLVSEGTIAGWGGVSTGQSIYFDDTPLHTAGSGWNFADIFSRSKAGSETQDPLSYKFSSSGSAQDVSVPLTIIGGTITRTISDPDVDAARILITVPSLLSQDVKTGDINETSVAINIYVNAVFAKTVTISGKCTSPYQRSILLTQLTDYAGSPDWDLKLTRTTPDSESATLSNDTYWTNYTELIYEKLYYPNSAIVAIEARADQFNNVPSRKYHVKGIKVLIPSNYTPVSHSYDGAWDGEFAASKQWTDNPAWILYDLLTNTRYGYGLDATQIDKASFYAAAYYNDGEPGGWRFTFNSQITSFTESFYVANMIASSMRGMLYWSTGKVYLAQDRPGDAIINVDNANVKEGAFNYVSSARKDRHTQVAVTWNDPGDLYRTAIEFVDDAVGIARYGVRRLDTIAFGCTDRRQATRWGRWILETELYETEIVNYVAGLDHAGVLPGDIVSVTDQYFAGVRFGGRVVSATTSAITLDSSVTLEGGQTYELQCILADGSIEKLDVTDGAGTYTVLNVSGTFTSAPITESLWQVIGSNLEPRQFRIITKTEIEPHQYQITATIYDSNKYGRVEDPDVEYDDPIYSTIPDSNVLDPPTNIGAEEYQSTEGQNRVFSVILSWEHSADSRKINYQVEWRDATLPFKEVGKPVDNSFVFADVLSGIYDFRVRTIGLTGKSPWLTLDNFEVYADTTAAIDITGLQIVGGGTEFTGKDCEFEWDDVTEDEADFKDYKIEIMTTGDAHLRYMFPTENTAVYTYEMNTEDNSGVPIRSIKVRAWVRDIYDSLSINADVATFSNPEPNMASTLPVVTPKYNYLRIDWANVSDNDMDYYKVYGDTSNPPTTEIATLTYPINQFEFAGIDTGTLYYVQIEAYDLFGVGSNKSQIPAGASPLNMPPINVDLELSGSITATDSDSNTASTLAKLYDRVYDSNGVGYTVSGTDKYINYAYEISNYFDRVAVWTADANASVYCAVYNNDTSAWIYYKDAGDDTNLVAASNQADAQANLWDLDANLFGGIRRNMRIMPNNIIGSQFRIYIRGTYSTTFYEFIPSRIIISELAAIETLAAISADVGTLIAGTIQSEDYPTSGLLIDIDAGQITGEVTFLAGSTGIANTDAGDLALEDAADFDTQVDGTEKPEDNATLGATWGTNISNEPTTLNDINSGEYDSIIDFDGRNNRDDTAVVDATISGTGTAVDHTVNTDGGVDISFEWVWGGSENDIDGFRFYFRAATSDDTPYVMGTTPAQENMYILGPEKRAAVLPGVPADRFYTFGIQAYRVVDDDIDASTRILSSIVQPALAAENPYQPSTTVAFAGEITGTIGSASDVSSAVNDNETFSQESDINVLQTTNAPAAAGANVNVFNQNSDIDSLQTTNAPAAAGADVTADNETFSQESDINVLQTTNAPAAAGADVTASNTANNAANYTGNTIAATYTAADVTADNETFSQNSDIDALQTTNAPAAAGANVNVFNQESDINVLQTTNAPAAAGANVNVFNQESDINVLQTTNAPAAAGADVTGDNQAASTVLVGTTAAATVESNAAAGETFTSGDAGTIAYLNDVDFADDVVGTEKPANNATVGAVIGTNLSGGSTSNNQINNSGYVTNINGGTITTDSITANQIQANAITASELAANSVYATNIVANQITTNKIIGGEVTSHDYNAVDGWYTATTTYTFRQRIQVTHRGGPCRITFNVTMNPYGGLGGVQSFQIRRYDDRSGTMVYQTNVNHDTTHTFRTGWLSNVMYVYYDPPGTWYGESWNRRYEMWQKADIANDWQMGNPVLAAVEYKR